jgi:hypothetical protein
VVSQTPHQPKQHDIAIFVGRVIESFHAHNLHTLLITDQQNYEQQNSEQNRRFMFDNGAKNLGVAHRTTLYRLRRKPTRYTPAIMARLL